MTFVQPEKLVDTEAWVEGGERMEVVEGVWKGRLPGGTGVVRARCGGRTPRCAEWSFHGERSDLAVELNCDTGTRCPRVQ